MFLGDGGAYLISFVAGTILIKFSNDNYLVSPYYIMALLWYPAYENLFSIVRKKILKKSPSTPDNKHLHMLSYYKISKNLGKDKANFFNSIFINIIYLILVIPALYLADNPTLSRYWFFILLFIYVTIYSRLYHLTKN